LPNPHNHILPTIATVGDLTHKAGELTLSYFRKHLSIADKGHDLGIVTEADLASEKLLKNSIAKAFPSHAILAEESGLQESATQSNVIWIIDPLDGTTNFSKGNPYYCVSVAVGVRNGADCVIERAAIHHPFLNDLYTAERGKGAFLNGNPIRVSELSELAQASITTGFAGNKKERLNYVIRTIEIFQNRILGMRVNGAAALDCCNTARGLFQGFFERNLSPWDLAAGSLILSEAGARVTDMEGCEYHPLNTRDICAANPTLHAHMLETIKIAGPWPGPA
jgi:myo-inositol-1(or 4)-monophosphatase